ncbi:MAG: 16S rRNA (cytidine(1402)-2'-O)-methyltransferase [Elusimicrobia bacterium]|nr:16S rRNA (cytidine(1402)-2'-O)-methyltransferase [Elusimicrobiota bacterium]
MNFKTTLYCVAMPIGNLGDFSERAKKILSSVDLIVCEDTRVTRRLLTACGLPPKSLWRFNEYQKRISPALLQTLTGREAALVVDAGTPGISDPAAKFLQELREVLGANAVRFIPIPGPSAGIAALSVSLMARDGFVFLGFLPRSPGKIRKELARALSLEKAVVFYESPHRIAKTLRLAAESWPNARLCLCRELTKEHEEILYGLAPDLSQEISQRQKILGEFVVVMENDKAKNFAQ